jgi:hypothetical protein
VPRDIVSTTDSRVRHAPHEPLPTLDACQQRRTKSGLTGICAKAVNSAFPSVLNRSLCLYLIATSDTNESRRRSTPHPRASYVFIHSSGLTIRLDLTDLKSTITSTASSDTPTPTAGLMHLNAHKALPSHQ